MNPRTCPSTIRHTDAYLPHWLGEVNVTEMDVTNPHSLCVMKHRNTDYQIRWSTPDGQQLSAEVWRRLAVKECLSDFKLGEHEGAHCFGRVVGSGSQKTAIAALPGNWYCIVYQVT